MYCYVQDVNKSTASVNLEVLITADVVYLLFIDFLVVMSCGLDMITTKPNLINTTLPL